MPRWSERELSGWGRVCRTAAHVARPERMPEVAQAMADARGERVLARGGGRSYGDAALNAGGSVIDMSRLDRLLEFDPATGRLVAEAGVTFGDLVSLFLPRGYMPPVVPGTGFATLGGGIANDIHGKNHHGAGSLGRHVEWFDLRLPDGTLRRVDRAGEPGLFRATVGGLGLTGVIERACLQLASVPSNAVHVRKRRVRDLDEHLAELVQAQQRSTHVVGWIDALARGRDLGRGILEEASASTQGVAEAPRRARGLPFDLPALALNPLTVRTFNRLYYGRVARAGEESLQTYARFLFPLDALHDWNRMYGKRGFRQFQCVVPFETAAPALRDMLERIARSGQASFLAVLKAMGPAGEGWLSFPRPGFTLALDFPETAGTRALLARLEAIACEAGGRIYLAKDSTVSPDLLPRMYPQLPALRALLDAIDPAQRVSSDLARRLGVRTGNAG